MSEFNLRGLYTGDDEGMFNFCQLIEREASSRDSVFFVSDLEGHGARLNGYVADDRSGWLVPKSEADEFETLWSSGDDSIWHTKQDYFTWAEWSQDEEGNIAISFNCY